MVFTPGRAHQKRQGGEPDPSNRSFQESHRISPCRLRVPRRRSLLWGGPAARNSRTRPRPTRERHGNRPGEDIENYCRNTSGNQARTRLTRSAPSCPTPFPGPRRAVGRSRPRPGPRRRLRPGRPRRAPSARPPARGPRGADAAALRVEDLRADPAGPRQVERDPRRAGEGVRRRRVRGDRRRRDRRLGFRGVHRGVLVARRDVEARPGRRMVRRERELRTAVHDVRRALQRLRVERSGRARRSQGEIEAVGRLDREVRVGLRRVEVLDHEVEIGGEHTASKGGSVTKPPGTIVCCCEDPPTLGVTRMIAVKLPWFAIRMPWCKRKDPLPARSTQIGERDLHHVAHLVLHAQRLVAAGTVGTEQEASRTAGKHPAGSARATTRIHRRARGTTLPRTRRPGRRIRSRTRPPPIQEVRRVIDVAWPASGRIGPESARDRVPLARRGGRKKPRALRIGRLAALDAVGQARDPRAAGTRASSNRPFAGTWSVGCWPTGSRGCGARSAGTSVWWAFRARASCVQAWLV